MCVNDTSTCEFCQENTTGLMCEDCMDGFFGNALNGGNCTGKRTFTHTHIFSLLYKHDFKCLHSSIVQMSVLISLTPECDCNGYNPVCDSDDGTCTCLSLGVTGNRCQSCDGAHSYTGDADNICYGKL